MAVSSSSVVHYTSNLDNLKGIIENGFRLKYCSEIIKIHPSNSLGGAFPMVCFCDIPLMEIRNHVEAYGCYGIGLSKKWAKNKGLNPVIYIEHNSNFGKTLFSQMDEVKTALNSTNDDLAQKLAVYFLQTIAYLKNYDGQLDRAKAIADYIFYNEREWRYVLKTDLLPKDASFFVSIQNYKKEKDKYNSVLKDTYLTFEPSDISYIIVKEENEIPKLIKHLKTVFNDKCTAGQLDIVITKLIAIENINNDF